MRDEPNAAEKTIGVNDLLDRNGDAASDMRAHLFKFFRWLNKRLSTSVEQDGLWVASWNKDDGSLPKMRAALDLIEAHDPRRYRRLLKDLRGIWAVPLPGRIGQFVHCDWLCEVDLRFVASATSEDLASVIVHEATHARLWQRGHRYEEAVRPRIEAICMREEKLFARHLPNPTRMPEAPSDVQNLSLAQLSDRSMEALHRHGTVAILREMNFPRWAIGLVLRMQRGRLRRRRNANRAISSSIQAAKPLSGATTTP